MTTSRSTESLASIEALIAQGEPETLEFKHSTAELRRAGETLCAFLNGDGGQVLLGVGPKGQLVGQQVTDITLRDIAATLGKIEPAARIELDRVALGNGLEVIVFSAPSSRAFAPFVYDDKPYERVGSTTTTMSQDEYMRLLLDRNHARHRWENHPAEGVRLEDLDHEETLRTRASAIEHRRLSAGTSMDASYILDNQQLRLHAFAMVREAIAWLDRTLPLAARFPKGSIFREDRQPVPAEALRETIINAVIHRDLSLASGYVAIAVFDDRIEVRSVGELPFGLRAEQLSGEHPSKPRNPDLAGAFHRTGAIEVWGRGANRVIDACRAWGIEAPTFKVEMGVTTVTFHAEIRPGGEAERAGTKPS